VILYEQCKEKEYEPKMKREGCNGKRNQLETVIGFMEQGYVTYHRILSGAYCFPNLSIANSKEAPGLSIIVSPKTFKWPQNRECGGPG